MRCGAHRWSRWQAVSEHTHTHTHRRHKADKEWKVVAMRKSNFHSPPPSSSASAYHTPPLHPIQLISKSPSGILPPSLDPLPSSPHPCLTFTLQRSSLGSLSVSHSHTSLPSQSPIAETATSQRRRQRQRQRRQQQPQQAKSKQATQFQQ